MKKINLFLCFAFMAMAAKAQCLTANGGLFPIATFTPVCNNTTEVIVPDAYAGEYANIYLTIGATYTLTSSITTDYITIGNAEGTVALAFGVTPLIYTATATGVVRFYIHKTAFCNEENTDRVRAIKCNFAPCSGNPNGGVATAARPTFCSAGTTTLSVSGQTLGVNIAYQWESSPTGANTWANVSGGSGAATATYATGTISTNTDFRCKITCTNAGAGFSYSTTTTVAFGGVPANDLVCNAIQLNLGASLACENTSCATTTGDPFFSQSPTNNTVWYSFTPPATAAYHFNFSRPTGVSSGLLFGWLGIYTASGNCPSLTLNEVLGNSLSFDLATNPNVEVTTTTLTAGITYYLMIDGVANSFGQFCIGVSALPLPPACVSNISPANGAINVASPVANFSWNASANATSYDVYFGTTSPPTTLAANTTLTTISLTGFGFSTQYYWYVIPRNSGGPAPNCGPNITSFTTQQQPPPPANDNCAGAILISAYVPENGSTVGATQSLAAGVCGGASGDANDDVWYKFIALQNGFASITCTPKGNPLSDVVMIAYSGSCTSLTTIGCADATVGSTAEILSLTGLVAGQTYYLRIYGFGNAGTEGAFELTAGGQALPVTLSYIRGSYLATHHQLSWATETELNNTGFEVQRSADGVYFNKLHFIATQALGGNSNATITYRFLDERPLAGSNYYRLKQIDKDGKPTFSQIILLKNNRGLPLQITSIHPNPARHKITMMMAATKAEKINLVLTLADGKVVQQQMAILQAGTNHVVIDVSHLAAGIYFIEALAADGAKAGYGKFLKWE